MRAALHVHVDDGTVVDLRVEPPLGAKVIRHRDGVVELHLVATAAGLLEGDELSLAVRVSGATTLRVGSAGATLVHPSVGGRATRLQVAARVDDGATLDWAPEPLIASGGSCHVGAAEVTVGPDAHLRWVEELVLGRTGESLDALRCTTELLVEGPDGPLLHDGLEVGGPAWDGPAVLGGARYVGTSVVVSPDGAPSPFASPWEADAFGLAVGGTVFRVVDGDPLRGRARLHATVLGSAPAVA